ncbi:MAG: YafY family transcriptional regulator [Betaproteobacteria bacterium]|nr:YafY family transcriptional regulator [Betaproteobacteria bacterium]
MRRADRLFQIIELLRGKRAVTARRLAQQLKVSERTVYRDIADLSASGVPIEGEAGVGYLLRRGFDLPPIMFDRDEIDAVVAGSRLVQSLAGSGLGDAAERVLAKVEAVLPPARRGELQASRVYASAYGIRAETAQKLDAVRGAINALRVVQFDYTREDGVATTRAVRPMSVMYWPPNWLLGGWCELRQDFRTFRLDRVHRVEVLDRGFVEEPGRSFADFVRKMQAE